jgi:hypothetical protein
VPRREKYVPKHRDAPIEPALKQGVRKSVVFTGVAVAATGIAVSSGVVLRDGAPAGTLTSASSRHVDRTPSVDPGRGGDEVSRSDRRTANDVRKQQLLDQDSGGQATRTEDLSTQDPRTVARAMLPQFGFADSEFGCLDSLYVSESNWNPRADNPVSSAYGIPQALTQSTENLPADYMSNPASQIRWGLDYIRSSYGTPCSAWEFKQSHGWY